MLNRVNQQERLSMNERLKFFLAGFIEGEGSLTISLKAHPTCKFGYYVDPEFFLYQHESGRKLLEMAQQLFQTGRIAPKSGNEKVLVYGITSRRSIVEKIIPYFEKYIVPYSAKTETFYRFKEICDLMEQGEHKTAKGLVNIVEKAYKMNPYSKGRERTRSIEEVCERILRDYTPETEE